MIEIDDAGSGSLIGGTCIGFFNTDSGHYTYEIIPLEFYKSEQFKTKKYLEYVVKIAKKVFTQYDVNTSTPIKVCRGYMFDDLRRWLTNNDYTWENTQITGILQGRIEKTFEEYAVSLGFPYHYIKYTKYPFHFHKILRWVYADFENRSKLCKTGWKSWQKYGSLPVTTSIGYMDEEIQYHCLKCGKVINPYKKVKILKYTSNAPNTIYLHARCKSR